MLVFVSALRMDLIGPRFTKRLTAWSWPFARHALPDFCNCQRLARLLSRAYRPLRPQFH